jgi:hypothetical protein
MGFTFKWDNPEETILRYTAEGRWNWNDYHKCVRMSLFSFHRIGQQVDSIIDLRAGEGLPPGAVGHIRSMARKLSPAQSGRAVVVGVDADLQKKLGAVNRELHFGDQIIHFADTDEEAYAVISAWKASDSP